MKEREPSMDLSQRAYMIIQQEKQAAIEANFGKRDVSELMEHIEKQKYYTEFAQKLGLLPCSQ